MEYFIFKGIDSSPLLIINKLPPIIIPDRNVEKIEVPGRNGFLTEDDGTYQGIIKPVECTIRDLSQIDFICSWLTGSGDVIFSNQPDRLFKATIINKIEFSKVAHTFHKFLIQFDCQPHPLMLDNALIALTAPTTLFNPGTAYSEPIIKIYGTGDITLTINSNNIYLYNVADYVTIDGVLGDVLKDTGLKNNDASFDWDKFLLQIGENTISWTGTVTKIEITPNWRYL